MKLIIAYIRPERLNDVKQSLFKRDIHKFSVSNALGCGEEKSYIESYRGVDAEVDLHKRVRIELGVNDAYYDKAVEGVIEGAGTGDIGDGKIFVIALEECVRIRTNARGNDAIG